MLAFLLKILIKFRNRPVILCYHRISKQRFNQQIKLLKKVAPIKPLKSLLEDTFSGKKKFSVTLTMDDCYSKFFHNAVEVCNQNKTPITFFIPTGSSKKQVPLWAIMVVNTFAKIGLSIIDEEGNTKEFQTQQEKEAYKNQILDKYLWNDDQTTDVEVKVAAFCEKNGYEITEEDSVIGSTTITKHSSNPLFSFQSHTITHPKLYLLNQEELFKEFSESKKYLEKYSGQEQYVICYPYGGSKQIGSTHNQAKEYYKYGVTLNAASFTPSTDPLLVPRIGIYEHDSPLRLFLKIVVSQFK